MGLFRRDPKDWPTEDDISDYLATVTDHHEHPYDPFPAQTRPRPTWRGGPPLDHADERAYLDEQDDQ